MYNVRCFPTNNIVHILYPPGNQPSIPLLPLQLMPSGDAGVYTVQAPIVNSTDSLSSTLSSFVFRVEENGEFDYFWQVIKLCMQPSKLFFLFINSQV